MLYIISLNLYFRFHKQIIFMFIRQRYEFLSKHNRLLERKSNKDMSMGLCSPPNILDAKEQYISIRIEILQGLQSDRN